MERSKKFLNSGIGLILLGQERFQKATGEGLIDLRKKEEGEPTQQLSQRS